MAAAAQNINNMAITSERKLAHLEQPLIPHPYLVVSQAARDAYNALYDAQNEEDGQSVSFYLLKMKSYLDTLERLGYVMPNELGVSLILNSLNKDYDQFVQNYNMHSIGKTIAKLHAMLKLHKKGIPNKTKTPAVLAIRDGKIHKDKKKSRGAKGKDKGKTKLAYAPKPKIPSPPKRYNLTKDSIFYHCNETWVYDTGYGTHICNTSQGLRESKKLKHGALSLYMGNGMRAEVEAIRSFDLILPSGLIIVLDNYYFAPTITRGVVSISCLVKNGYRHTFTNYGIFVLKDNLFYFNTILRDGIYKIDMHNLYSDVSSMFNVSNKRAKRALDSSYLWHCRLGHINKKCMDKIQRDGILQPTHNESLKKCKSCISGKMASKPFPHQVERAKDLLGLIHTDVCGPFRNVSREGASYFITFTDDFSHYGYVYLIKHKHEMFETFKVFQNEVKNQLVQEVSESHGLLKSSRSDEGLEIIQEKDTHPSENTSKEHNEIAHTEEHELGDLNEPPNYKTTLSDPKFDKWIEAINTEIQSIKDNQVRILVDLPPNGRTVRSKWLFMKKTNMDENVHTFKARLVAKGYTQTYSVDYGETFSPCR
nr:hypothetical protein [Tanacetum cinerariifolium]